VAAPPSATVIIRWCQRSLSLAVVSSLSGCSVGCT